MGCAQSIIDNEEAISRLKDRKRFMREAVSYRNAFAAAHYAYAMCLKNTGAALSDYTRGEFSHDPSSVAATSAVKAVSTSSSIEIHPPPLPNFQNHVPFQQAASIHEIKFEVKTGMNEGFGEMRRRSRSLIQKFTDIDDHFEKASESANEVSEMLEALRLHHYSNFADNRGHIDYSYRMIRAITSNHLFKGFPYGYHGDDDLDTEENETHATVLDRMLSWEKRLYDEVKAGKFMKYKYQKMVALLNKQKRISNPESLEKLKADARHLHTKYIVGKQSIDSTVAEINRLRDEQLYPKLVQLVDGMATMWETMHYHQSKILCVLKSLDSSEVVTGASECGCCDRTTQLCEVVSNFRQFCRLLDYQKEFIRVLNNWSELNLIPIKSNLKDKVSSPPQVQDPPIHAFLIAWNHGLENLPDEISRSAMRKFGVMMQSIVHNQFEETKMRRKCDATRKELKRKHRRYEKWRMKNELDAGNPREIAMEEKESVVISLRQQLAGDEEECLKICRHVREKFLASQTDLFRAMSEMALACSVMFSGLRSMAEDQHPSPDS